MMTAKDKSKDLESLKQDPRYKLIAGMVKKAEGNQDALIQLLHAAQGAFGYLPLHVIDLIAKGLNLSPSQVYGVVTFYHFFSLKPKGEHTCLVCTGTACYVKGAQKIIDEVEKHYQIKPGEVTKDNKLGLQTARCIGACGLAPAVVLDDNIIAKVQPEDVKKMLQSKIEGSK